MVAPIKPLNLKNDYRSSDSSDEESLLSVQTIQDVLIKDIRNRLSTLSKQSSLEPNDQAWLESGIVKEEVSKDHVLSKLYVQVLARFDLVEVSEKKNGPATEALKIALKKCLTKEITVTDMFWILLMDDLVKLSNDSELIETYNQVKAKIQTKDLLKVTTDIMLFKV